jgi:hypothetical protein
MPSSCQEYFKQGPVDPDERINRDHDRDENFSSKVRQKNFMQGLVETRSSKICSKFFKQGLPKTGTFQDGTSGIFFRFMLIRFNFFRAGSA